MTKFQTFNAVGLPQLLLGYPLFSCFHFQSRVSNNITLISLTYNIINIKVGFVLVASMSIFKVQPQCYCLLYIYIARLVVFFFFFQLYYNLSKLYNKGYFELDGNSSPLCHMKRGRFLAFGNYHGWLA